MNLKLSFKKMYLRAALYGMQPFPINAGRHGSAKHSIQIVPASSTTLSANS